MVARRHVLMHAHTMLTDRKLPSSLLIRSIPEGGISQQGAADLSAISRMISSGTRSASAGIVVESLRVRGSSDVASVIAVVRHRCLLLMSQLKTLLLLLFSGIRTRLTPACNAVPSFDRDHHLRNHRSERTTIHATCTDVIVRLVFLCVLIQQQYTRWWATC